MLNDRMIDAAVAVLQAYAPDEIIDRETVGRAIAAANAVPAEGKRPSLTPRQREVFEFIRRHIAKHGTAPSVREIAAGVGLSSIGATHRLVSSIIDRGYLNRVHRQQRSIALA